MRAQEHLLDWPRASSSASPVKTPAALADPCVGRDVLQHHADTSLPWSFRGPGRSPWRARRSRRSWYISARSRWHRRDPAQHHCERRAGPAARYQSRQGRAVQQDPDQGALIMDAKTPKARYARRSHRCARRTLERTLSVRAFCRRSRRATIEHVLTRRSARIMVQQSALAGVDRQRRGKNAFAN